MSRRIVGVASISASICASICASIACGGCEKTKISADDSAPRRPAPSPSTKPAPKPPSDVIADFREDDEVYAWPAKLPRRGELIAVDGTHFMGDVAFFAGVARTVRVVPKLTDAGVAEGLQLHAVRPSSSVAQLGFANGDLVVAINGVRVVTPEIGLEIYAKLRSCRRVVVIVVRAGVTREHHYLATGPSTTPLAAGP